MSRLRIENLCYHGVGPIDLALEASELVALSGPSGAGKTLMLRSIADLEPHEGFVYLDGMNSTDIRPPEWRRKVGMLPAESQWWGDTVREHFREINEQWLEMIGLDRTAMWWQVNRLSTGERQRLALLRLLCNRPKVLLLDEPTANLDVANIHRVEELLKNYIGEEQTSVVWVSHDIEQIHRMATRHLVLENGKLSEKLLTG